MFRVLVFTIALRIAAAGFIAYDCDTKSLNVTTLSLLDVASCDVPPIDSIQQKRQYVQLLQLDDYQTTDVLQCKIEVKRTIYYCGRFSHVSVVAGGEGQYVQDIDRETCQNIFVHGTYQFDYGRIIKGIKKNETNTFSVTIAGDIDNDGSCEGVYYSDPYGSWKNVVVQGLIKITVVRQSAKVNLDDDKITMESGVTCKFSGNSCMDQLAGKSFWSPFPADPCKFQRYGVLYEGLVTKLTDNYEHPDREIYTLESSEVTFALEKRGTFAICGHEVTLTEHPKLFIFETTPGKRFAEPTRGNNRAVDIFTYMNSKFIYTEYHVKTQMRKLYRDILTQKCELERKTLKNSLAIATQAPDQFAYNFMKGPGYMAFTAGEVVHILKCIPVDVMIEHSKQCYAELRVKKGNDTFYMMPRTHILKTQGTRVDCNRILPAAYRINDGWVTLLPEPQEISAPAEIKPVTKPTWKYIEHSSLANSGIYKQSDLDRVMHMIMFPMERPAMINDLAREMIGKPVDNKDGSISRLLNENSMDRLLANTWMRLWNKFMVFGTASAGILTIFLILGIIKTFVGMILNGYALHEVHGCSVYIFGAIWSTLAHFLIYLGSKRNPEEEREEVGRELMQVLSDRAGSDEMSKQHPEAIPRTSQPAKESQGFFNLKG